MDIPNNIDDQSLFQAIARWKGPKSVLQPEDEAYLTSLVELVRAGKRAVIIVEDQDERLKYMFSNATRAEAMQVVGKVIEATGKRLAEEQ